MSEGGAPPTDRSQWPRVEERRRAVARLMWRTWTRAMLGNTIAGATVGLVLVGAVRVYPGGVPFRSLMVLFLILGASAYALVGASTLLLTNRIIHRYVGWYWEGRDPSADEIQRLASLPRMIAIVNLVFWSAITGGQLSAIVHLGGYRNVPWSLPKGAAIYAFGYVVGSALAYLLVEREFRPFLQLVLPRDVREWPRSMGLGPRLVLAWFVVAGAPLVLIAFTWVGFTDEQQRAAAPVLRTTSLMAAGVGLVVFLIAGRTITAPLTRLQHALRRVAAGELTVHVDVDEAGEIGHLEAGFNEMVEGLRERERMRDVFGRYVGPDVARHAMEREVGALGGDVCDVTAMFVDVIGSTRLAERRGPDEVVALLNDFFAAVVRVVGDEGGFVNQFQGDGALCLFGAPDPQDDHHDRGLRAARVLARELASLEGMAAAIGVSSGRVVAGHVGSADRYEFTVIGDPVNEASRLSDEAKKRRSRVLASEQTVAGAEAEASSWTTSDEIQLRGRSQPTVTYVPINI